MMLKKQFLIFFYALIPVSMQVDASWHRFVPSPFKAAFRYVQNSGSSALKTLDMYTSQNSCLKRTRGACSHFAHTMYPATNLSSYQRLVDGYVQEMNLDPINVYKVPFSQIQALAAVEVRGMAVCEKQLENYSDLIKEFVLKHELTHHKYSDLYSKIAFFISSGCCTAGSLYLLYKNFGVNALYSVPVLLAGWFSSLSGFKYYQEGRADKEAAFAAAKGCPGCMDEIAELHKPYKTRTSAGYLGFQNYKKYADGLRNAKSVKYCQRHTEK